MKHLLEVGCWFCPKQRMSQLKYIYETYPNLWNELKVIEKDSPNTFKIKYTIEDLEKKFANNEKK